MYHLWGVFTARIGKRIQFFGIIKIISTFSIFAFSTVLTPYLSHLINTDYCTHFLYLLFNLLNKVSSLSPAFRTLNLAL